MKKLLWYLLAVAIALLILIANSFYGYFITNYYCFAARGISVTLSFIIFSIVYHRKRKSTLFYVTAGLLSYVVFSLIAGSFYTGTHPGYKMTFFAPWVGLFFGWLFNNVSKLKMAWKVTFLALYFFIHYAILFDKGVHAIAYSPMINNSEKAYPQEHAIGLLSNSDTLFVRDLNHEISIFHFWNSACGSCKKEMELYPEIIENFKERAMIYPANSEMPRDTIGLFYSLPQFADNSSITPIKGFGVKESPLMKTALYPSTVVLDKNGNMLFIGNLENAIEKFQ
jgi:thiol-disulfide isomerase/thioredoxin